MRRPLPRLSLCSRSKRSKSSHDLDAAVGFAGHFKGSSKIDQAMRNLGKGTVHEVWSHEGSKPFIYQGRMFTAMGDTVVCIEPETDQEFWRKQFRWSEGEHEGRLLDTALTSPALANRKAFVGSVQGKVLCLSTGDGQVLDEAEIGEPVGFQPAVAGGRVYVPVRVGACTAWKRVMRRTTAGSCGAAVPPTTACARTREHRPRKQFNYHVRQRPKPKTKDRNDMNLALVLTIAPYWHSQSQTWVIGGGPAGPVEEPLMEGVPQMIDALVQSIPNAKQGFRLLFSAQPFPGWQKKLTWLREEAGGDRYACENPHVEVRLRPTLLWYFDQAPAEIYVKAEAFRAETQYNGDYYEALARQEPVHEEQLRLLEMAFDADCAEDDVAMVRGELVLSPDGRLLPAGDPALDPDYRPPRPPNVRFIVRHPRQCAQLGGLSGSREAG